MLLSRLIFCKPAGRTGTAWGAALKLIPEAESGAGAGFAVYWRFGKPGLVCFDAPR
jgi:hypothetical protein